MRSSVRYGYVGKDAAVTPIRAIDVKEGHRILLTSVAQQVSFPHVTHVEYIVNEDSIVTGILITFKTHTICAKPNDILLISTHPENPYRAKV